LRVLAQGDTIRFFIIRDFSMRKPILNVLLFISLSYSVASSASQYSTSIVNSDSYTTQYMKIDYTICNDKLENNPTCSKHTSVTLFHNKPLYIDLQNQKEVVYVWYAQVGDLGYSRSNFKREIKMSDKSIITSDCAAEGNNFIVLDTHATDRIGCQSLVAGQYE
jgi:hypothetical protein